MNFMKPEHRGATFVAALLLQVLTILVVAAPLAATAVVGAGLTALIRHCRKVKTDRELYLAKRKATWGW